MSLPSETVKPRLAEFAAYARSLKGDEKGEAQLFLDRFFRALGHTGIKEAGATLEFRIAKKPGSAQLELITDQPATKAKGGKKFADLLWPDRVLIEMKKRGEHLESTTTSSSTTGRRLFQSVLRTATITLRLSFVYG